MSIIHNKVKDNFSIVTNSVLRHRGLSWKAKGIYAYLCGCESGFNITQAGLAAFGDCGVEAVASGIEELESFGLVEIEQSNEGRFGNNKWTINSEITVTDFPVNGISDNGKSATNKSIDNKININNPPPSASVGDDADYEKMMERRLAKEKKSNRKPVEVKEPIEIVRPQEFKDFLAVFKWAGTDDKWIYEAWMKALQAGKKPSELVLAAKAHARQVSSPQFLGYPQSWLSNGKWALYAPKKVQAEAIKPLFPSASDMVAKNCSNDEIELVISKYDKAKDWWAKQAKPTIKEMLEYLKKTA